MISLKDIWDAIKVLFLFIAFVFCLGLLFQLPSYMLNLEYKDSGFCEWKNQEFIHFSSNGFAESYFLCGNATGVSTYYYSEYHSYKYVTN